jgi:uncharacterized membrane protein
MPDITLLGWFHTIIVILALLGGFYTLAVYKVMKLKNKSDKIYLSFTMIAAVTALMIYNQGAFGPAHMLAILTVLALITGFLVNKIPLFSNVTVYFQTLCYTGMLLFHMIPAITDGLLRLPVNDPVLTTVHDPLLRKFYLLFLMLFFACYVCQVFWLKQQARINAA